MKRVDSGPITYSYAQSGLGRWFRIEEPHFDPSAQGVLYTDDHGICGWVPAPHADGIAVNIVARTLVSLFAENRTATQAYEWIRAAFDGTEQTGDLANVGDIAAAMNSSFGP